MAVLGHVDYISRSYVQGWACDTEYPDRRVSVIVKVNGVVVATLIADRPREGLQQATKGQARDNTEFRFEFDPPLSVFRAQDIEVLSQEDHRKLPNGRRLIAAPVLAADDTAAFRPVLLSSTGRSGSTMMMNELLGHPDIVIAKRYPFEIKQIAYYAAAFRNLVLDADRVKSTHPEKMLSEKTKLIGSNPYCAPGLFGLAQPKTLLQAFYEADVPTAYAGLFRQLILQFYTLLAESDGKQAAPYFCEKGDISRISREGARLFFGRVKDIVLIRDPRGLLSSAIAFWKLTPDEALATLRTSLHLLEEACDGPAEDTLVVRYEDLVLQPKEARRRMSDFLGIELESAGVAKEVKAGHRTSSDPLQSISRWKEDLSAEMIAACDTSFAGFMERFGYMQSGAGRKPVATHIDNRVPGTLRVLSDNATATKDILGRKAFPVLEDGRGVVLFEHTIGRKGTGNAMLTEGWSGLEDGGVWSKAASCRLALAGADAPGRYEIQLCLAPFTHGAALPAQRLHLTFGGADLGTVSLHDLSIVSGRVDLTRRDAGAALELVFSLPDAACPSILKGSDDTRLLGVSLRRVTLVRLETGAPAESLLSIEVLPPSVAPMALRSVPGCGVAPLHSTALPDGIDREAAKKLMYRFESLGENCEFGLVQRKLGAEPAGLLRFASAPIDRLIEALKAGFDGMGALGQIEIERAAKEYMVFDKRFGFRYHAWVMLGEKEPADVVRDELVRVPVLIEKLKEDLALGQKIFVYHGMGPLAPWRVEALDQAMRAYGANTLLWVDPADAEHPAGTVERCGPHLLKGYIDRFAPRENAYDFSLPVWLQICTKALEL